MNYSEKIIMIREKFCLSQNNLANLLNVSIYDVRGWENGTQNLSEDNIKKFYDIFRTTKKMLLNDNDKCEVYFMKKQLNKNYQIFDFINEYYSSWRVCALKKEKDLYFLNAIVDIFRPYSDPHGVIFNRLDDKFRDRKHFLEYLLENGDKTMLITYKKEFVYAQPIVIKKKKKRFKYNGYIYRKIGYLE